MLDEARSFWQNLNPQYRGYVLEGALALAALLGGHMLGAFVKRFLRARRFDSIFRMTGQIPGQPPDDHGFTPTPLAGHLVRLTVWAFAAAWLLRQHDRPDIADTITKIIGPVWAIAAGLAVTLAVAGLLTRRVMECLESGAPLTGNRTGAPSRTVAGAAGAGIYVLVLLFMLLTAADYFDWPQTRNALADVWQLALRLLTAGAAVLVGYLGARWAREFATPQSAASDVQPAQRTALAIVVGSTALAVALLVFTSGLGLGVAALVVIAALVFLGRGRLADAIAGLKLKKAKVGTVWFEGVPWQVEQVGFLQSDVSRDGTSYKVANQLVLEAAGLTQGAPESDRHEALMR